MAFQPVKKNDGDIIDVNCWPFPSASPSDTEVEKTIYNPPIDATCDGNRQSTQMRPGTGLTPTSFYAPPELHGHDLKSLSISESTNDDDLREQLQRMERKQRDHSAERKANTDEIKRLKERIDIMEKEINTLRPKNKRDKARKLSEKFDEQDKELHEVTNRLDRVQSGIEALKAMMTKQSGNRLID